MEISPVLLSVQLTEREADNSLCECLRHHNVANISVSDYRHCLWAVQQMACCVLRSDTRRVKLCMSSDEGMEGEIRYGFTHF